MEQFLHHCPQAGDYSNLPVIRDSLFQLAAHPATSADLASSVLVVFSGLFNHSYNWGHAYTQLSHTLVIEAFSALGAKPAFLGVEASPSTASEGDSRERSRSLDEREFSVADRKRATHRILRILSMLLDARSVLERIFCGHSI